MRGKLIILLSIFIAGCAPYGYQSAYYQDPYYYQQPQVSYVPTQNYYTYRREGIWTQPVSGRSTMSKALERAHQVRSLLGQ